jgi:hypothetical protein
MLRKYLLLLAAIVLAAVSCMPEIPVTTLAPGQTTKSSLPAASMTVMPTSPRPTQAPANLRRSGAINSSETWSGIVDVTGDITINYPATLTIEPGTVVRFAAQSDDQSGGGTEVFDFPNYAYDPKLSPSQICNILVNGGVLRAIGTLENPIRFTLANAGTHRGDWQSIELRAEDTAKHKSQLFLQHTVIRYAYWGVRIFGNVMDSDVLLKDNDIGYIVASGISIMTDSGSPVKLTISGNDMSLCSHEAVYTGPGVNAVITGNLFHDDYNGVIVDYNSSAIYGNQFIDNHTGIAVITEGSTPDMHDNVFRGNDIDTRIVKEQVLFRNRSVQ